MSYTWVESGGVNTLKSLSEHIFTVENTVFSMVQNQTKIITVHGYAKLSD